MTSEKVTLSKNVNFLIQEIINEAFMQDDEQAFQTIRNCLSLNDQSIEDVFQKKAYEQFAKTLGDLIPESPVTHESKMKSVKHYFKDVKAHEIRKAFITLLNDSEKKNRSYQFNMSVNAMLDLMQCYQAKQIAIGVLEDTIREIEKENNSCSASKTKFVLLEEKPADTTRKAKSQTEASIKKQYESTSKMQLLFVILFCVTISAAILVHPLCLIFTAIAAGAYFYYADKGSQLETRLCHFDKGMQHQHVDHGHHAIKKALHKRMSNSQCQEQINKLKDEQAVILSDIKVLEFGKQNIVLFKKVGDPAQSRVTLLEPDPRSLVNNKPFS